MKALQKLAMAKKQNKRPLSMHNHLKLIKKLLILLKSLLLKLIHQAWGHPKRYQNKKLKISQRNRRLKNQSLN
jgi:hypothetical protein